MIYKFNLIERILLNKNIIPHPLSDIGSNVGLAKALGVAVKLNITDHLSATPARAARIAEQCNISEKGTQLILNCLEAMGYVDKSGDGYKYNKRGLKFLSKDSPDNFKYFILFADWTYDSFTTLEDTIRAGKNEKMNLDHFGDYEWEIFSRAMIELSNTNIQEVMKKIKIAANAKQLIDLGGSHGLYSIGLCKKKSDLKATILDLEPVRKYADECIGKHKMEEQVTFQHCDFRKEDIPSNNDMALLFNIIHGMQSDENEAIFKKIFDSLNPGGEIIILDQIKGTGGKSQLARATTSYMAINLFHQANGNTYSFKEVEAWALKAGCQSVNLKKLNAPGFALITCKK